jgi:RNA polymerase sigma factor (sigma-70 family)
MKATAAGSKQGVTGAQMREAERGLKGMLVAKFPRAWIAEHSREVLGQAHVEYQEWLETNPPARNPVGWLCTCAYRRALNLRDSERRRPTATSLDTVFHLADERTPTPEQEAIERDRQERLRAALSHLPEKEVKLLALVYFEDNSIREAGRKLGWQKSAADRHHNTAMEKLRALVGDDRSLFSPATLGLAAYLACRGGRFSRLLDTAFTPARELLAIGAELASVAGRRLGDLGRALSPFSDTGAAAANSGVGRGVGVCGAGIVTLVCVGVASVVAPGLNSAHQSHRPLNSSPVDGPVSQPATVAPAVTTPKLPTLELPMPAPVKRAERSKVKALQRPQAETKPARASRARKATPKQTQSEFGIDGGSGSTTESAPAPTPESAPESSTSAPSFSSPPASSKPSGSSATREFGL